MAKSKKGGKKSNKGSGEHNPQTEGGPDSVRGNIAALTTEVKTTNSLLESSADYSMGQTFALQNINNVLVDMYNDVHAIHELMVGNKAQSLNPFKGIGRNDPCPCESGKKFKQCCGQSRG